MFEIQYISPDIIAIEHDDSARIGRRASSYSSTNMANNNDPRDPRSRNNYERGRQKTDLFQKNQQDLVHSTMKQWETAIGSTQLTIMEVDKNKQQPSTPGTKDPARTYNRREKLYDKKGDIKYTMQAEHTARICIQSFGATSLKPSFISLRIKDAYDSLKMSEPLLTDEEKAQKDQEKIAVDDRLKYVEREIYIMVQNIDRMISSTTTSKLAYSSLRDASVKMQTKLKWIVIFQISIILITAAFYVKNLIAHFRRMKLIF
jgi:hypothetical protein